MTESEHIAEQTQSEEIGELIEALSNMQKTELLAATDSVNPFFKSRYASLSSVWNAIRVPLTLNGLAIVQTTEPYKDGVTVKTVLGHRSGQWISGKLSQEIIADKKGFRTPQGLLSLITYLRRAGVSAITGLCPFDDDGNYSSRVDSPGETPVGRADVSNLDTTGIHEMPSDKKLLPIEFPNTLRDYPIESQYPINVKQIDDRQTHWIINGADVFTDGNGHYYSNASGFSNPVKCTHVMAVDAIIKFGADVVVKEYPNISMIGD